MSTPDRGRTHPEHLTLRVLYAEADGTKRTNKFDVEIWHETDTFVIVSPRTRTKKGHGCVKFVMNLKYGDRITIDTVAYNSKCTARGTDDMTKKNGTRSMVIGAMHCVRDLAETRWPEIKGFELHDEGAYTCPPLDMELRTTASDILLHDSTYYERHYNMTLEKKEVADKKSAALEKIHGRVAMNFEKFWSIVMPDVELYLTEAKHDWLVSNKDDIERVFRRTLKKDPDITWRMLARILHNKYGCTFFAATLTQFTYYFDIMPILGAAYVVDFSDLPQATVMTKIYTTVELRGGRPKKKTTTTTTFPLQKMENMKALVRSIEFHLKTAHKYVHRRRRHRGAAP